MANTPAAWGLQGVSWQVVEMLQNPLAQHLSVEHFSEVAESAVFSGLVGRLTWRESKVDWENMGELI